MVINCTYSRRLQPSDAYSTIDLNHVKFPNIENDRFQGVLPLVIDNGGTPKNMLKLESRPPGVRLLILNLFFVKQQIFPSYIIACMFMTFCHKSVQLIYSFWILWLLFEVRTTVITTWQVWNKSERSIKLKFWCLSCFDTSDCVVGNPDWNYIVLSL